MHSCLSQISSSAKNFPVLHEILCWLHQLLLLHPPGQCHTVDLQYAMFIDTLSQSGIGGMFGLWEHITELLRYANCSTLGVFLCEVLASVRSFVAVCT